MSSTTVMRALHYQDRPVGRGQCDRLSAARVQLPIRYAITRILTQRGEAGQTRRTPGPARVTDHRTSAYCIRRRYGYGFTAAPPPG